LPSTATCCGSQQPARGALERLERVAGVVGEKAGRPRPQASEELDLIVLERERLEAARKLDAFGRPSVAARPPMELVRDALQHREDSAHVPLGTRQHVVVEHVPAVVDRQRMGRAPLLPHAAKPAAPRTTARRDRVARPDVAAGHKLQADVIVRDTADLYRRDVPPLLGEPLGCRNVVLERDRHVDLVGFGE
jgi:hypothetical protein